MFHNVTSEFKQRFSPADDMNISIGITTFEARFENYFVPLLNKIRDYDQETEIIVAVNGEHKRPFSEGFRKKILSFIATKEKVFPIFFPRFRGLSKLWNTILIHAGNDHILILNDDIMIENEDVLKKVKKEILNNPGKSFVINESWSHYMASKKEMDEIGYFDERLLGIGEEDGDFFWRYIEYFGKPLKQVRIRGIRNYAEETKSEAPSDIESRPGMKYSAFNRSFIKEKYAEDPGGHKGMFDKPVKLKDSGERQYPYERFFLENREKL